MKTMKMWVVADGFGTPNYKTLSVLRKDAIYLATKTGGMTWEERVKIHDWRTQRKEVTIHQKKEK